MTNSACVPSPYPYLRQDECALRTVCTKHIALFRSSALPLHSLDAALFHLPFHPYRKIVHAMKNHFWRFSFSGFFGANGRRCVRAQSHITEWVRIAATRMCRRKSRKLNRNEWQFDVFQNSQLKIDCCFRLPSVLLFRSTFCLRAILECAEYQTGSLITDANERKPFTLKIHAYQFHSMPTLLDCDDKTWSNLRHISRRSATEDKKGAHRRQVQYLLRHYNFQRLRYNYWQPQSAAMWGAESLHAFENDFSDAIC